MDARLSGELGRAFEFGGVEVTYVCINSYNESKALPRCIASARTNAPHAKVVVVDGAYEKFPHGEVPASTDGSLEAARETADIVIECQYPSGWPDEIVKRSSYFIGKPGDAYVVVDADEEIVGPVPECFPHPFMDVMLDRDDGIHPYAVYRIHTHQETGIRYEGSHNSVWTNGTLTNAERRPLYEGFRLMHHYTERTAERQIQKGRYYDWLAESERQYRNQNVLY